MINSKRDHTLRTYFGVAQLIVILLSLFLHYIIASKIHFNLFGFESQNKLNYYYGVKFIEENDSFKW